MSTSAAVELCVVGLVYFEVFVPSGSLPNDGEESFVAGIRLGLGGALNTASVAKALGRDVVLAHPVGVGLGDMAIAQKVSDLGISVLNWPARNNPAISLVFSGQTDRSFLSAADFDALRQCVELPSAQWIHVPGLAEARLMAAPLARARAAGARICVSGSWAPDELAALKDRSDRPWDLLILNAKEATHAVEDAELAPERLEGVAANVIVTNGGEGAFGRLHGQWVSCPGVAGVAIEDFTGAGDAFCGGLLTALLRGSDGVNALQFGCAVAARVLTQPGGVVEDIALLSELEPEK
jgi:sugar/nucleoside kinase (ribokinase family)